MRNPLAATSPNDLTGVDLPAPTRTPIPLLGVSARRSTNGSALGSGFPAIRENLLSIDACHVRPVIIKPQPCG